MSFPLGALQFPAGVRILNPFPVDYWSGPFTGSSIQDAVNKANSLIPQGVRFRSMEVRLVVGNETYKYWYYGGTQNSDLVEFVGSSLGENYVESLNGITGPIQISAGDFVHIELVDGKTMRVTALEATFDSDITASFSPDKSFGKYTYGQRVPAANRTARDIIRDALLDTVSPLLSMSSSTQVKFFQSSINNGLNFTHNIQTIGATGASGVLEFRKNNTGNWSIINTAPTLLYNPSAGTFSGGFTHSFTDSAPFINPTVYNYRYTVYDSRGASGTTSFNITSAQYIAPSISLNTLATSGIAGGVMETQTQRERGNTRTTVSGSAFRSSELVELLGWRLDRRQRIAGSQYSTSWTENIASGSFAPGGGNITQYNDVPSTAGNIDGIQYRLVVTDAHQISSSQTEILFDNLIWYGPTAAPPTTSSHIRSGGLLAFNPRILNNGNNNPFQFNSGTVHTNFVVALPSPSRILSVIDINNLSDNVTDQFLTADSSISWPGLFFVNDSAGNSVPYNVYTRNDSEPFIGDGGQFVVTRT